MPRGKYDRTPFKRGAGKQQAGLRVVQQRQIAPPVSPKDESRRERLQRLGPARVANAVKALRHLRQLANPVSYDLRPKDVDEVLKVIGTEVQQLDFELRNPGKVAAPVLFGDDE